MILLKILFWVWENLQFMFDFGYLCFENVEQLTYTYCVRNRYPISGLIKIMSKYQFY